jgi:hypothetical protein
LIRLSSFTLAAALFATSAQARPSLGRRTIPTTRPARRPWPRTWPSRPTPAGPRTSSCSWATAWASPPSPPAASMKANAGRGRRVQQLVVREAALDGALQDLQPRHPGHRQRRRHHRHHHRREDPQQGHRPDRRDDPRAVRHREGRARRDHRRDRQGPWPVGGRGDHHPHHPRHPGRRLRPHRLSRLGRRHRHAGRGDPGRLQGHRRPDARRGQAAAGRRHGRRALALSDRGPGRQARRRS